MTVRPTIVVVDDAAPTAQLLTQRLRELGVFSEYVPTRRFEATAAIPDLAGVVVCAGDDVPDEDLRSTLDHVVALGRPVLCVGAAASAMCALRGGRVERRVPNEGRSTTLETIGDGPLLRGTPRQQQAWMPAGREVLVAPEGFDVLARDETTDAAAVLSHRETDLHAVRLQPEIGHSEFGMQLLENFVRQICGVRHVWDRRRFVEETSEAIGRRTGSARVLCPVSGGVDSMVAAKLLERAVGDRLCTVFVNTGLMRHHEPEAVAHRFGRLLRDRLVTVDATEIFLDRLSGVADAQKKRRVIEATFVDVLETAAREHGPFAHLVQGTLYSDRIEGAAAEREHGHTDLPRAIRGLPERVGFDVLEPLRELFKDDVRAVGRELGVPHDLLNQHPFPRSGLAIRVLGPVDAESLDRARRADRIFIDELRQGDLYDRIWQAGCVLLPVPSAGLEGDTRSYEQPVVLRAVTSVDSTSAAWARIPDEVLDRIGRRILAEVDGINRVVYDISNKPPATIEWE